MLRQSAWQSTIVWGVVLVGMLFAAPNLFSRQSADDIPGWLPNQQISLGLDLQGGAHLLYQVDMDAFVESRMEGLVEAVRNALRGEEPKVDYTGGISALSDAVIFRPRDPAQADLAIERVSGLDAGLVPELLDNGDIRLSYTEAGKAELLSLTVEQAVEVVRRRIDEFGLREPTIQRQGDDRIIVQLPGVDNPDRIKDLIGEPGVMTFHMVNPAVSPSDSNPPRGTIIVPSANANEPPYAIFASPDVRGEYLEGASAQLYQNQWVVNFRFNGRGGRDFCEVTSNNVNGLLAIVLDGEVISAPRIDEPICGGSGIIRGRFSSQGANDLSVLLRAGALPAPLIVMEERTVGPGLGADSIESGAIASVIGFAAVVAFMAAAYGLFGVLADIALIANLVLLIAVLSILQATLTLPGIAGIVLTVGMAVDANVLIFERIREELALGKAPLSAIDAGYKRALTTIIDSNLTTLIAALLLFNFGAGPIKGFAVTLSLGIITSMFSAIMLTRFMVVAWMRRARPKTLKI